MPYTIDEAAFTAGKNIEAQRPPVKQIPHLEYPKMLYLHPKDKQRDHRTVLVNSAEEEKKYRDQGWRTTAHVPAGAPVVPDDFEADLGEAKKPK